MESCFTALDPLGQKFPVSVTKEVHIQPVVQSLSKEGSVSNLMAMQAAPTGRTGADVDMCVPVEKMPILTTLLTFEGLPGAGKSYVAEQLVGVMRDSHVRTPVVDSHCSAMRDRDQQRWNFLHEISQIKTNAAGTITTETTMDTSPLTTVVSVAAMVAEKRLHPEEYKILLEYSSLLGWLPRHIVYIDTEPMTAYHRVRARGKPSDTALQSSSFVILRDAYEEALSAARKRGVSLQCIPRARRVPLRPSFAGHGAQNQRKRLEAGGNVGGRRYFTQTWPAKVKVCTRVERRRILQAIPLCRGPCKTHYLSPALAACSSLHGT
jgi:hypothetical protein